MRKRNTILALIAAGFADIRSVQTVPRNRGVLGFCQSR